MKSKIICIAAAMAAAGAITAVAVAQGSGDEVVNESIPAVESSVVSDETDESDMPENTEDNESDASEIAETTESAPTESDGTSESAPAHYEGTVEAVDPVDDRITYTFDADAEGAAFTRHWSGEVEDHLEILNHTESNSASLEYLKEFFGTDSLPVDERFKGGIERVLSDGHFDCDAAEGAEAYSPVEGRVIVVSEPRYNGGLGAFVAVEFDNKIFIIAHLDELYVEVGDAVSAGQALGVCGHSGSVYVGDPPLMTLITMIVED